ncbi:MAG: ABC transporter ATP-binding protein [Steroidobacteraceae bacterium]
MTSLTPHLTVGAQLAEIVRHHERAPAADARRRVLEISGRVRINDPERQATRSTCSNSGGMRQRIVIASALILRPALVIADEPTTALDVTVQAEVLRTFKAVVEHTGTSILVTHDLGVVAGACDEVAVMYAGRIVERTDTVRLFHAPRHPYTKALLACCPGLAADPGAPLRTIDGAPLRRRPATNRAVPSGRAAPMRWRAAPRSGPTSSSAAPRRRRTWPPATSRRCRERAAARGRALRVHFPVRTPGGGRALLHAVDDVSFVLAPGETLGVVGESGCGKSTLARALLRLVPVSGGRLRFQGEDYTHAGERALGPLRRAVRMVFQDPLASLDPRCTVGDSVREPLDIFEPRTPRPVRRRAALAMLEHVGLGADFGARYPHELSGGQNQRVNIARALIGGPRLVICDESVSALDVSIQAQILNLLAELQRETGIALLFISHDLSVVRHVSRRLLVLYLGRVMESGDAARIFAAPRHPYTRALIDAVPVPDPVRARAAAAPLVGGELPSPLEPPSGCVYRTRCPRASPLCKITAPPLASAPGGVSAACHHPLE